MLRNTAMGLAVTASLSLAGLTPAIADIPACMAHPNADTCPTMGAPTPSKGLGAGTVKEHQACA